MSRGEKSLVSKGTDGVDLDDLEVQLPQVLVATRSIPGFPFFSASLSPRKIPSSSNGSRAMSPNPPLAADSICSRDDGMLQITTAPDPNRFDRSPLRSLRLDPRHHGPHPRSRPGVA